MGDCMLSISGRAVAEKWIITMPNPVGNLEVDARTYSPRVLKSFRRRLSTSPSMHFCREAIAGICHVEHRDFPCMDGAVMTSDDVRGESPS